MSTELKPCPFCGGEACMNDIEYESDVYDPETLGYVDAVCMNAYSVVCASCAAAAGFWQTKECAAEAWNRRAYEKEGR